MSMYSAPTPTAAAPTVTLWPPIFTNRGLLCSGNDLSGSLSSTGPMSACEYPRFSLPQIRVNSSASYGSIRSCSDLKILLPTTNSPGRSLRYSRFLSSSDIWLIWSLPASEFKYWGSCSSFRHAMSCSASISLRTDAQPFCWYSRMNCSVFSC